MKYGKTPSLFLHVIVCLVCLYCFQREGKAQIIPAYPSPDAVPALRTFAHIRDFPAQQIRETVQDSTGFMWIATYGAGLVRFDGRGVKFFKHRDHDSATITNNNIWRMSLDSVNRLWLFYFSGAFDLFDPATETVRHLSAELHFLEKAAAYASDTVDASQFNCQSFFEDSRHRSWIILNNQAACIDAGGKEPVRFYNKAGHPTLWSLASMNETPQGHLLFAGQQDLVETDEHFRVIRQMPLPPQSIHPAWAQAPGFSIRNNDTVYLGAYRGVNVYNARTGRIFFRGGLPPSAFCINRVSSPQHNRFLFYDTSSHHLYSYTAGEGGFRNIGRYVYGEADNFMYNASKPYRYFDLAYCFDRWGGLWHNRSSVFYSSLQPEPYDVISGVQDFKRQVVQPVWHLPDQVVSGWKNWYESYPWVRSPEGAVYIIDSNRTLRQIASVPPVPDRHPGGNKWLVLFNGIDGRLLSAGSFDGNNRLWIADNEKRELFTIDPAGNIRVCPQKLSFGFDVTDLLPASGNSCWTVNYGNGLCRYSMEKGLEKTVGPNQGAHPLPATSFLGILRDSTDKNILWINTLGAGLIRFNERTETWTLYSSGEALPAHDIYTYLMDRQGFMWYCTKLGIYRFDTRRNHVELIVPAGALKVDGILTGFSAHLDDNLFYFGLANTAVLIHPNNVQESRNIRTALTGIKINNKPVPPGDTSLVPVPLNVLSSLRLAYDQNFISFQFAALDFTAPDQTGYRYRMKGIDPEWIDNGTDNSAQYTSLPPGDYLFEVNATNADGNWSPFVKSIRVTITPPWWRTGWMYALYAILFAAAVWLFIQNRLRQLRLNQQVVLKQKEAEQAQALEETKSRFFANITHELRTPLTLILSPVQQQLQQGEAGYSPQLLKGVYHNSRILLRLINQLLDMSKLEAGSMPVTLSRGNIGLFVESLLPGFRQQAAAKRLLFTYEAGDLPEASSFDPDKLEKVVFNLLSNAFKFTPEGGGITLSLHKAVAPDGGDVAMIRVTDTGIGIAPEHLPYVFDRFYQANTSTTRRFEGTGIGLALTKELVELNGGSIDAESVAGEGSVFTVRWPLQVADGPVELPAVQYPLLHESTITDTPEDAPANATEGKPVVLVTDDNDQLRAFIKVSLEPHYKVLTAMNGQSGLQTAQAELPDLIISDVMMPVMDGYEFCASIKANPVTSHIAFIMLTAKTADESRMGGLRLGADQYLGKPFIVDELLLVVSNLLTRQQKLRELYSKQLGPEAALPPVNEIEDKFLASVYEVIEQHLDSDKLDVEFLAGELAVSRRTLNRKLAAIAGTSANELIRNYRLKKATVLLVAGHTVSETAFATGFSTPSWFNHCFKELYGITPGQYADNARTLRS